MKNLLDSDWLRAVQLNNNNNIGFLSTILKDSQAALPIIAKHKTCVFLFQVEKAALIWSLLLL